MPMGNDELVYEFVADELAARVVKQGLWTKALADTDWDESKAKASYVRIRFAQIQDEHRGLLSDRAAAIKKFEASSTDGHGAGSGVASALASGLTDADIQFLKAPIAAVEYLRKYRWSKDELAVACARDKLKSVTSNGVLWVEDREIKKPSFLEMPSGRRILD